MTDLQPAENTTETEQPGPPAEPPEADKPVGELVADLTSHLSTLLRKEVELAMSELKGEIKQAVKAGGMLSGGALTGYLALLFASLALAWFLDSRMPRTMAFFLVAALHGTCAATLLSRARQEIQQIDPVPTQTVETIKENVDWVKAQTS
jgi:hypothetical protein